MDSFSIALRFDSCQETDFDPLGYIDCPTARLINSAISEAVENDECLTIVGPPGCGKSMAVKYAVHGSPYFRYTTATPASAGMKAFLRDVNAAFGLDTSSLSLSGLQQDLWRQLRRIREECRIALICDEAQNLELKTLRTAMFLHDEAGLPVILVGNSTVLQKTKTKQAGFDQITDRQGPPLRLNGITRGDIEAFGVHHGVEGIEAYGLLAKFSQDEQSFRGVVRLLKRARSVADPKGSIQLRHIEQAILRFLGPAAGKRLLIRQKPRFESTCVNPSMENAHEHRSCEDRHSKPGPGVTSRSGPVYLDEIPYVILWPTIPCRKSWLRFRPCLTRSSI